MYAEQRPFDHDISSATSPHADILRSSPLLSSPFSLTPYASPSASPLPASSPVSSSPGSLSPVHNVALLPLSPAPRPSFVSSRWYWTLMAVLVLLAVQQWIVADRAKRSQR